MTCSTSSVTGNKREQNSRNISIEAQTFYTVHSLMIAASVTVITGGCHVYLFIKIQVACCVLKHLITH